MANPYYALRRIRRARSSTPSPPSPRFGAHREAYESILTAVHDLAGDAREVEVPAGSPFEST